MAEDTRGSPPAIRRVRREPALERNVDPAEVERARVQEWHPDAHYSGLRALIADRPKRVERHPQRLRLHGRLLQPDGRPAAGTVVTVEDDDGRVIAGPAATAASGAWSLDVSLSGSSSTLAVRGAGATVTLGLDRGDLLVGALGTRFLPRVLAPVTLPAEMPTAVPATAAAADAELAAFTSETPSLSMGEGDCARTLHSYTGPLDRFRYGVHVRLAGPGLFPLRFSLQSPTGAKLEPPRRSRSTRALWDYMFHHKPGHTALSSRTPISSPVNVEDYLDDLVEDPFDVPRAATLGIGYVVRLVQQWTPAGLSLGDLVYSLPLAPGEEQRLLVRERHSALDVRDEEHQRAVDRREGVATTDSSNLQLFQSALREQDRSFRQYASDSSSDSIGGGFSLFGLVGASGGSASTSSSGSGTGNASVSRDMLSSAVEQFHSAIHQSAAASRQAQKMDMRVASLHESVRGTVRTVANHNHTRALTMQWWQVLRHFSVETAVDDVNLVVHVPLEIVRWLPAGQARHVDALPTTRSGLLLRYARLLQHAEVLRRRVWHRSRLLRGLESLVELAANPMMRVKSPAESAEVGIHVEMEAHFLVVDEVNAWLFTRGGRRFGPVPLAPVTPEAPLPDAPRNRSELISALQAARAAQPLRRRVGDFSIPREVALSDLVRLELAHTYQPVHHQPPDRLGPLQIFPILDKLLFQREPVHRNPITLRPSDLASELPGGEVGQIAVTLDDPATADLTELANTNPAAELVGTLTVPLALVSPMPHLARGDLACIEELLQWVLERPVVMSKAVWESLSAEERVLLLEPWSLGPAPGDLWPNGEEVPLLDCVENRVMGFFGNCMILPFHLPPGLAAATGVTTKELQEALVAFHRDGFAPIRTQVALPTRGTLGEAVLGDCVSAERIDLTRFWNWPDAPLPGLTDATANAPGVLPIDVVPDTGAAAPTTLRPTSALGPSAPAPPTDRDLLAKLIEQLPTLTFDRNQVLPQALLAAAARGTTGTSQATAQSAVTTALKLLGKEGTEEILSLSQVLGDRKTATANRDAAKSDLRAARLAQLRNDPQSLIARLSGISDTDKRKEAASAYAKDLLGGTALSASEATSLQTVLSAAGTLAPVIAAAFGIPL
jgi:hypothetical protein